MSYWAVANLTEATAREAGARLVTKSDNVHIERNGVACHARAEATETNDAERFAGEPLAHRHASLETAGSHRPIGGRDGAGGGDWKAERQFSGCVGSARSAVLQTMMP